MSTTTTHMRGEREGEVIAAIEYRRVTRKQLLVPHAVYTVRPEHPNWLASIYDFDWCAKDEIVCYHNSGSGGNGLFLSAFSEPGKIGQPLWWNPEFLMAVGMYQKQLSRRTLKRWGYKVVSEPLGLLGTIGINPFGIDGLKDSKTEYCKHCRSYMPADSDADPCEHLIWSEEHFEFRYREASINPETPTSV